MKKLLALVLALVMTMSLVTISNAAFKDADKISNKEAVDVMAAVGVLAGYDNGEFGATDTLTRAQAAKIIAYLDLGKDAAEAFSKEVSPFADVAAGNWAAGYIAYCAQAGIVAGIGGNKFGPDEKVTGLQFAKMLLVVLGYDAGIEKMTGADWQIAVAKLAASNKLFKGSSASVNAPATREEAAQYAYNALKADMVKYSNKGGTINIGSDNNITFGASSAEPVAVASEGSANYAGSATTAAGYGYQQLCERLYGTDIKKNGTTDSFGRPATRWTYKAKEVGVYADTATLVYTDTVKSSKIYSDLGLTANVTASTTVDGSAAANFLVGKSVSAKTSTLTNVGTGTLVEVFYDDSANTIDITAINYYPAQVTNVTKSTNGTSTVYVSGLGNAAAGTIEAEGYAIDDIVYVTYDGADVKSIAKAQKVTAAVTTYTGSNTAPTKVTAGTVYTSNVQANYADSITLKSSYDLYLDANGYVVYSELYKAADSSYAYVLGQTNTPNGITEDNYTYNLLFADGTTKVVKTDNSTVLSGWVSFVESNGIYTLYSQSNDIGTGNFLVKNNVSAITVDGANYYANSTTVFVVKTVSGGKTTYTAYTGIANAPTIANAGAAFNPTAAAVQYGTGNVAKFVFVDVNTNLSYVSSSTSSLIYVTKSSKSTNAISDNDGSYYTYNAMIGTEPTVLKVSTSYTGAGFTAGELAADAVLSDISYNSKGIVVGAVAKVAGTGENILTATGTKATKNGNVGLGYVTTGYYTVANDVTVFYINGDGEFTQTQVTSIANDANDTVWALLKDGQVKNLYIKSVSVTTPAVSATLVNGTLTVTVENFASASLSDANLSWTVNVAGTATVTGMSGFSSGVDTATVAGPAGSTGWLTITVTNTIANVGSANATYTIEYTC